MKKKDSLFREIIAHRNNYLFMAPFMLVFLTFTVIPVLISIFFSFTYFNVLEPPQFVGLQNFYKLFLNDSLFLTAFSNTLILAVITGPVGYVLSLFLAWVLNEFSPALRTTLTFFFYTDFFIDLLFYNRALSCLVPIELKIGKFKPEHIGQINFYLEALDRDVKKPNENPSVGVILCASKDDAVVEYALSRSMSPTLVADYRLCLPDKTLLQNKLRELTELALESGEGNEGDEE